MNVADPKFWKWLLKLDLMYMDFVGIDFSIVDQTGWECWWHFYEQGESPYWTVVEDLLAGM